MAISSSCSSTSISSNSPIDLSRKPVDYQIAYQKIITKISAAASYLEPSDQMSLTDKQLDRLTKKTLECIKKQDGILKNEEVSADRLNHWLDNATWLVVRQVGALMFDNHLGSGGQNDVYLGVTPERTCAVKVNKEEASPARESAFLETLAHSPHVIDRIAATEWYQIEPLYPEDLSDLCYNDSEQAVNTPDKLRKLKRINHHLLQGIAHMHERGIVHGDLKPENILLDESGDIKIGDFGTAFKRREPQRGGTHVFFAPEQIHHYFRHMEGENGALLSYPTQIDVWQGMLILAQLNKGNLSPDFQRRLDEYLNAAWDFGHETKNPDGTSNMEQYVKKINQLFEDMHKQRTENGLSISGLFSDLTPTTFLENLLTKMSSFHPKDRINSSEALKYFERYCANEMDLQIRRVIP